MQVTKESSAFGFTPTPQGAASSIPDLLYLFGPKYNLHEAVATIVIPSRLLI